MLIRFYRSSRAGAIFTIPLFTALIWSWSFFHPRIFPVAYPMPLYELVNEATHSYPLLQILIAFILVSAEAMLINYLVDHFEILNQRNNLPALFYALLLSSSAPLQVMHPALFSNLFILLAFIRLIDSYRKEIAFSEIFDTGFLMAVASLFYAPVIIFLPLIYIGIMMMRPFIWREWVILFTGFMLPFLFASTWYYWQDSLEHLWIGKMFFPIVNKSYFFEIASPYWFLFSLVIVLTFFSIGKILFNENIVKLRSKKTISLLFWMILFSALSLLIAPSFEAPCFSFFAIPLAVFIGNYFLGMKYMLVAEVIFILLVAGIIMGFLLF